VEVAAAQPAAVRNPYSVLPNWLYPSFVVTALSLFGLYAVWVVFFNDQGRFGPYLSPFFSPNVHIGRIPPAIWVAWAPLAFRLTCYYYRKAYFRSFFWHPRSCAVGEPRRGTYRGETGFWALNNFHRYAFYATFVQVGFLWYDVFAAFFPGRGAHLGLGAVIMLVNVICLSGYTFGCHAFRHLAGGGADCLSCHRARFRLWKGVTVLNVRHGSWAWASLVTVLATDVYIRLLIAGVIPHAAWV
jgi:hypothetical protein